MTSLPEWLVERAALDEVGPASRDRVDRADPNDLAERVAAIRAANAAELAAHPAGPAVAQIEARAAAARTHEAERPRPWRLAWAGALAALVVVLGVMWLRPDGMDQGGGAVPPDAPGDETRVKGEARLLAFRQAGERADLLPEDAVVYAGDVIQLRYNGGGARHGVIASLDGAGVVTLHFPATPDAPTALAAKTTTLPQAYALDDAPRFERFFFITADAPLDVPQTLDAVRALAARSDGATAQLELPAGERQWSLRLRKPTPTDSRAPSP